MKEARKKVHSIQFYLHKITMKLINSDRSSVVAWEQERSRGGSWRPEAGGWDITKGHEEVHYLHCSVGFMM